MLSLTRKTDYALVALAYLGQKRLAAAMADESALGAAAGGTLDSVASSGSPGSAGSGSSAVSAREIADQFGLPLPVMMAVLKELGRARLVISTRGAAGGYALAVDPAEVTLLEVVEAIEGPLRLANCADGLPVVAGPDAEHTGLPCRVTTDCPIRRPIKRLHDRLNQFLSEVTLADLLETKVDVTMEEVGR